VAERTSRHVVVTEMITELRELVEDEVARILCQVVAGVVDLFDVRLGAVRLDHIFFRIGTPCVKPVEPLLAHAFGQNRNATTRHDLRDRDATSGVVAS